MLRKIVDNKTQRMYVCNIGILFVVLNNSIYKTLNIMLWVTDVRLH